MMSAALQPASAMLMPFDRLAGGLRAGDAQHEFEMRAGNAGDRAALEDAAAELVSSAFVLPLLEGMNASPLRPQHGPFAITSAEKRFSPLLFQHFADRVVKSARFSLVTGIADRYTSRAAKESTDVRA